MPAPYDPTRQHSTNDLSRSDFNGFPGELKMTEAEQDKIDRWLTREQRQDRASMVREAVKQAGDLAHTYGNARASCAMTPADEPSFYVVSSARASDAYAKLMILVSELARAAYE